MVEMKLKRAVELHSQGAPERAAGLNADILHAEPNHPDALHLMGVTETQAGRSESGLALITRSLALNPNQPVAIANQGNAYLALHRPAEALASFDRVLRLAPGLAAALNARGGVPVVTCAGASYAAHMSGSLLSALGLSSLIVPSLARYEELALQLAQDAGRLRRQRSALDRQKMASSVFDTARFCRHLEAAFTIMVERQRSGLPPATFRVNR